ncbi:hypothetical protein Q3G72_034603 [Acer saccharum]|nr:hypothetical protein Q3G72_034603 [Acer saccharum]
MAQSSGSFTYALAQIAYAMMSFEWDDDCFNHTKSPSSSHLCISILHTFYPLLQLFHPEAKNFKVVDILYNYLCPIAWIVYGTQKVPGILPDPSIKW